MSIDTKKLRQAAASVRAFLKPEYGREIAAAADRIDAQAAEIAALRAALEEMVNEPQPTGIDRPVYQMALAALEKSDAALSGESND